MGGYGAPVVAGAVQVVGAVGAASGIVRGVFGGVEGNKGEEVFSEKEKEAEQGS